MFVRPSWTKSKKVRLSILSAALVISILNPLRGQSDTPTTDVVEAALNLVWSDLDSTYYLLRTELQNTQDPLSQAQIYLALSKAFNQRRECDSIQHWNQKAELIFNDLDHEQGSAEVLYQKGFEAFCIMDYTKALEYILQGLDKMQNLNDVQGIALGHLRMSRIFHFTSKMPESADYGRRAAPVLEKFGDYINAWDSWSFAGHGYRMSGDSVQAIECFENGMQSALKSQLPEVKGMAYNDLAAFYNEADNYDSAIVYFQKAFDLVDPEDERQKMVIANGLGQSYLHSGQYQACIDLLSGALQFVQQTNERFFMSEVPEYIAQSYAGLGKYDSAYKYMEMNWRYTDSLFTKNQDEALEEMKTKYESDQKDQLISQRNSERKYGIGLLILSAIIAFVLYRGFINKKKNNEQLQERNKEKDFLLREIHHRVKNNLQVLSSLLNLQAEFIVDESALNVITEGRNRVQSMSFIHQQLYSEDNITSVNMKVFLADLCDHLGHSFSTETKSVEIKYDIQTDLFDVETAIPLGLIVNELITNSIKYAFTNKSKGIIIVKLWENENDQLCLLVSDDGQGPIPSERSGGEPSFGTDLIKILSQKLKGTIKVDTAGGYSTIIKFDRYKLVA